MGTLNNSPRGMQPTLLYYHVLCYQSEAISLLEKHFRLEVLDSPDSDSKEILGKVDVILAPLGYYFGRDKFELCKKLKIIGSSTTGHPHIDIEEAAERNIKVLTLKSENKFLESITPTAELTWGLIIALSRNLPRAQQSVREGNWSRWSVGSDRMLSRMKLGVVGYGRLGRMVANYGVAFGMDVYYHDLVNYDDEKFQYFENLEELVALCDVVTAHIPHEESTENLFDQQLFDCFKTGAYFVNTSRGEIVDDVALLEALRSNKLAGAACDVFPGEYLPDFSLTNHPLWSYFMEHENLILTPHIGGSTIDAWRETQLFIANKIIDHL